MYTHDAERWEEYEAERDACEQDAFEEYCDEQDIDSTTEEAVLAWRALLAEEALEEYKEQQITEFAWHLLDEQEDRAGHWE